MEFKRFAGVAAAATIAFGIGAVAPASADASEAFGLQQTVADPSGGEIGYTVTKFLPSEDAIPTPVSGQLYEVTVRADALNGMPTPVIPAFSAHTEGGQSYPALAGIWTPLTLSGATLLPGSHSSGKIYFDAVGEPPTSVVYSGGGETLTWTEPPTSAPKEEGASSEGEGSGDGSGAAAGSDSSSGDAAKSESNSDVASSDSGG